jgi:hypothetical protein
MKSTWRLVFPLMIVFGAIYLSNDKPKGPFTLTYELALVVVGILGTAIFGFRTPPEKREQPAPVPCTEEENQVPDISISTEANPHPHESLWRSTARPAIGFFAVVLLFFIALLVAAAMSWLREQR